MVRSAILHFCTNLAVYVRTRRRSIQLLDGRMEVFFLGSWLSDLVPLIFGESFWMIRYDGWLFDPGGPRMRASMREHLRRTRTELHGVTATHAHEEHAGNLSAAAELLGVGVWVHHACESAVRAPDNVSVVRRVTIGQPAPFEGRLRLFDEALETDSTTLEVYPAPGHANDHVVFYDRAEKLLLAGDAFVSSTFTTPNAEVDSHAWLRTLHALEDLDIEILVGGHGRIYTLRHDIPDVPGVVVRQHPMECLRKKRVFMEQAAHDVARAAARGERVSEIRRRLFQERPDNWIQDTLATVLSFGEFSRTEFVRSYMRSNDPQSDGSTDHGQSDQNHGVSSMRTGAETSWMPSGEKWL